MSLASSSIKLKKQSCSSSQPGASARCGKSVPLGNITVLSTMEVVPVPEQAVSVEQSVTKLLVTVPEMMFVPWHLVIGVAEQVDDVDDVPRDGLGFSGSLGWGSGGGEDGEE